MRKRLYRSRKDRMIGGVSGGIAGYFDIDPVIVRALFIITTLGWGLSIVAYIVLWIIVPDEEKVRGYAEYHTEQCDGQGYEEYPCDEHKDRTDRSVVAAIILIAVGILFLLDNIAGWLSFGHVWPLAVIGFGAYILYKNLHKNNDSYQEVER